MKTFRDLFLHFLEDMYYAEQQILKTLPGLVIAADDATLRAALDGHVAETREQIVRLESVFASVGEPAKGVTCEAILGLLQETEDVLKQTGAKGPVQDAGIVACLQAVGHYEIARFTTLAAWADAWGKDAAAKNLREALDVEQAKSAALTSAEGNARAAVV